MTLLRLVPAALALSAFATIAAPAQAAQRTRTPAPAVGRAVPRPTPPVGTRPGGVVVPRFGVVPYRPYYYPYYYPYRFGWSGGFYAGYPFGYYPYGYYPYGLNPYGYYGPYGYPTGYLTAPTYGGVRIQGAPADAQVFADGYFVGVVDDFNGVFQRLPLTAGTHQIEIRVAGQPTRQFDVRIEPGQTITYRAR